MEDLKQIQEFFSKPLNENVFVEAFKLQKALEGMGYDVKVKAVDDFGTNVFEIYFNNPADADDDSIFYDVEKLGYDNVRVFANPQESVKENSRFEKRLAKMAADEKEKRAKSPSYAAASKLDVDIEDFFEKGQSYQEFKKRLDKLKEYNSGIYFDPNKAPKRSKKVSKSTLDKIADIVRKATVGDYEPSVTEESKPKKATGEKISKEVFSKLKGKTITYKGHDYKVLDSDEAVLKIKHLEDGDVTTINLRQFNLKGMIEEILETIELGRQLNEKLCKKGEEYRKKRMAAGEKSSAYLSGRAVKVCKGQMKG